MNQLFLQHSEWSTLKKILMFHGATAEQLNEYEASGNPVVFETNVSRPLQRLLLTLLPKQSGTGDPSPSNIRPLLPWGEVGTWTGGANVFDGEMELGTYNGNTGNKSDSSTRIRTKGAIPVKGGATYRFVTSRQSDFGISWLFYDKDDGFISNNNRANFGNGFSIPIPENACYMRFSTWDSYGTVYGNDIGINYPSTETAFVPYTPITPHPVNVGDIDPPVYGCEIDLTTGEGAIRPLEIESFKWGDGRSAQVIGNVERRGFIFAKKTKTTDELNADATARFCSVAPWGYSYTGDNVHFYGGEWSFYVFLPVGTSDEFEFQICAERDIAPTQFTLTPQQVNALVGVNTVWSDADNVDLTYLKKG